MLSEVRSASLNTVAVDLSTLPQAIADKFNLSLGMGLAQASQNTVEVLANSLDDIARWKAIHAALKAKFPDIVEDYSEDDTEIFGPRYPAKNALRAIVQSRELTEPAPLILFFRDFVPHDARSENLSSWIRSEAQKSHPHVIFVITSRHSPDQWGGAQGAFNMGSFLTVR